VAASDPTFESAAVAIDPIPATASTNLATRIAPQPGFGGCHSAHEAKRHQQPVLSAEHHLPDA
jgi:hypothetical protein